MHEMNMTERADASEPRRKAAEAVELILRRWGNECSARDQVTGGSFDGPWHLDVNPRREP
jgi:hypothetical protein